MAATETKQIYLVQTGDGRTADSVRGKIAASQGILMPGSLLYLSTSGTWKVSDTCDGTGDAYHGQFMGLVNTDSTWPLAAELAASTEIMVQLIDIDDIYAIKVEASGVDAAAPETLKGDQYGLTVSTTTGEVGYATMDTDNATVAVKVVDVGFTRDSAKYDTTTAPGTAYVQFLSAVVNQARS